jgi:hypothetical protein
MKIQNWQRFKTKPSAKHYCNILNIQFDPKATKFNSEQI